MYPPWDTANGASFSSYNIAVFWPVTDVGAFPDVGPINADLTEDYALVYQMQGTSLGIYIYTGDSYEALLDYVAGTYGPGTSNPPPPLAASAFVLIPNFDPGDLGLAFQEIVNPLQIDGVEQWFHDYIPAYTAGHQALLNNGQFEEFPTIASVLG
jgi:hypothetical protein